MRTRIQRRLKLLARVCLGKCSSVAQASISSNISRIRQEFLIVIFTDVFTIILREKIGYHLPELPFTSLFNSQLDFHRTLPLCYSIRGKHGPLLTSRPQTTKKYGSTMNIGNSTTIRFSPSTMSEKRATQIKIHISMISTMPAMHSSQGNGIQKYGNFYRN